MMKCFDIVSLELKMVESCMSTWQLFLTLEASSLDVAEGTAKQHGRPVAHLFPGHLLLTTWNPQDSDMKNK
ncbi:hypothetical protein OPV22_023594 [Ensete ventricosum]|uniref:Clp R domain-containing protein n=1 Tax=Ensete ventricosum TaxID=4639 RepID=A0AAV8QTA2_ENSVE|nr:hypothetical protein OPV22_023594 [Ensete ventricosum]